MKRMKFVVLVTLALFCVSAILILPVIEEHRKGQVISCLHNYQTLVKKQNISPKYASGKYALLSAQDYLSLIRSMPVRDICNQVKLQKNKIVDKWGNKVEILVKKDNNGDYLWLLWSVGKDKKARTQDDVTYPYHKTLPF